MRAKRILIVDDEPRTRQGLRRMLESWGAGTVLILDADNGHTALRILDETAVDLLITDIRMPEISGLSLVERLRMNPAKPMPSIILISGFAEFEYAHQALQLGIEQYLLKPVGREKLIPAVERALEAREERSRIGLLRKIADPRLLGAGGDEAALSEPVREALEYVDEHLERTIGLREVAGHVHLNASYFSVLFKEQMQMTLSEYITRRKLQKAKEMLLRTKVPVAEIAERVGYQTAKYFNKVFKDYEGFSPGQYRTEMTGETETIQK